MLPPLQLAVDPGPGAVAEDYERSSRNLRDELLGLDVDAVTYGATVPPSGAKAFAGVDTGTLVVTLSNSAVLVSLVGVLKSWAGRSRGRKVTMRFGEHEDEIEIDGASRQDLTEILQSWAARHDQ
jgi:Effector Associated Constant Component 1